MTENDKIYMRRCFELARKGLGLTRTNPLVGSVIVHNIAIHYLRIVYIVVTPRIYPTPLTGDIVIAAD